VAFTYGQDPKHSPRDHVRLIIGDTQEAGHELEDSELDFLLEQNADQPMPAAASACELIGARYLRRAESKSLGKISISYAGRANEYFERAKMLTKRGIASRVRFYFGGRSRSEKAAAHAAADATQPAFTTDPVAESNVADPATYLVWERWS
jgi:hypothetical protein